ncbi:MAG: lipocalin-like domain-containing protein [Bacteroidetes bacterium]|nr:MAG: lipocalin-like domain-containing protein [Bacteroidota bacterium]
MSTRIIDKTCRRLFVPPMPSILKRDKLSLLKLSKMSSPILPSPSGKLAANIQGVWWLLAREDWTASGDRRIDPILGPDPIGILAYAKNKFTAQVMKRNRTNDTTA